MDHCNDLSKSLGSFIQSAMRLDHSLMVVSFDLVLQNLRYSQNAIGVNRACTVLKNQDACWLLGIVLRWDGNPIFAYGIFNDFAMKKEWAPFYQPSQVSWTQYARIWNLVSVNVAAGLRSGSNQNQTKHLGNNGYALRLLLADHNPIQKL